METPQRQLHPCLGNQPQIRHIFLNAEFAEERRSSRRFLNRIIPIASSALLCELCVKKAAVYPLPPFLKYNGRNRPPRRLKPEMSNQGRIPPEPAKTANLPEVAERDHKPDPIRRAALPTFLSTCPERIGNFSIVRG